MSIANEKNMNQSNGQEYASRSNFQAIQNMIHEIPPKGQTKVAEAQIVIDENPKMVTYESDQAFMKDDYLDLEFSSIEKDFLVPKDKVTLGPCNVRQQLNEFYIELYIQEITIMNQPKKFILCHFLEIADSLSEGACPYSKIDWGTTEGNKLAKILDKMFELKIKKPNQVTKSQVGETAGPIMDNSKIEQTSSVTMTKVKQIANFDKIEIPEGIHEKFEKLKPLIYFYFSIYK